MVRMLTIRNEVEIPAFEMSRLSYYCVAHDYLSSPQPDKFEADDATAFLHVQK